MSIDVPDPYWTNDSLSITVQTGDGATPFSFDQPFTLLGSHPDCDLVLEEEGIERRSLLITLAPTAIYGIVLCASAKKAGRVFSLEENRTFKLGRCEISVSRQANAEQLTVDSQSKESISVVSWKARGGRLHAQLPNHRPIVLGRREPARIVVEDEAVSAVHCCLYRSTSELWAIDLCSSHGTWRKGKAVKVARLNHGNAFTAGATRFHFLNFQSDDVVESLSSAHVEQIRGYEEDRMNWVRHRTILLSSLGQLHDGLDRQTLQAEQESELLLARISELESQLAAEISRHDELVQQHQTLQGQYEQVTRELNDLHREHATRKSRRVQERYDLDERDRILKSIEMDAAKRELELIAMRTKLRKEQEEFELLRRKALASGEGPSIFASPSVGQQGSRRIHDETCISSPNFVHILNEAIESQYPGPDD